MRVVVVDGGVRHAVPVPGAGLRIGRDPDCELRLDDATVSRLHAVIRPERDGWELVDHESRNGTTIDGFRIDRPTPLVAGVRVGIGRFTLVLEDDVDVVAPTEDARAPASGLTGRELEILRLVVEGATDQEIAARLVISVRTVHSHLDRIRDKAGVRRRPELIRWAGRHGLA